MLPSPAFDVLCVGLVCLDFVFTVPHHPGPDEKIRANSRQLTPGGPAAVAAAQIARLGGRPAFAGLIGDPAHDAFAALLYPALTSAGIDTSALLTLSHFETPLAALLVKPDATRTVVSHRPTPPAQAALPPPFPPARVVLTDGHRPEWRTALVAHARALGIPLVLDAGSWSDSVRALTAEADHVVASEACARSALGRGLDPADPDADLHAALGASPTATVVVTLGPRGLVWRTPTERGAHPAFRVHAVDTTGAGDAFHGAYALALARGLPRPDLLRFASAAGALACTHPGAWTALANSAKLTALLDTRP